MNSITRFLSDLPLNDPIIWLAFAGGITLVVLILFIVRRQRRPVPVIGPSAEAAEVNPADVWLPAPKRPDERRKTTRREGVPTAVFIVDPKKPRKVLEGFVLDRSSGGLRLASKKPFTVGLTVQLRPTNAPPESLWTEAIVRSCIETSDYYEVGCQFQEQLPLNQLLMFG